MHRLFYSVYFIHVEQRNQSVDFDGIFWFTIAVLFVGLHLFYDNLTFLEKLRKEENIKLEKGKCNIFFKH